MFKRDRDPNPGFYPTVVKEQFPSRPQIWYDKGTKFTWTAGPGTSKQLDPFSIQSGAQQPAWFNMGGAVPDVEGVKQTLETARAKQEEEMKRQRAQDLEDKARRHKEKVEVDAADTIRVHKHKHYTEERARQEPTHVNVKVNEAFQQRHHDYEIQMEEHKRRNAELQQELQGAAADNERMHAELRRANQQNEEWAQWHQQNQNQPAHEPEVRRDIFPPEHQQEPYRYPTEQDQYYDAGQFNLQRAEDYYTVPEFQRQEDLSQFVPWRNQERPRQRLPERPQETQGRNEFERQGRRDEEPDAFMADAQAQNPAFERHQHDLSKANQRSEQLAQQLNNLQKEYVSARRGHGNDDGDDGALANMQEQYARLHERLEESQRYAIKLEAQVGQANQLTKSSVHHLEQTEQHLGQAQIRLTQYDDEVQELIKQIKEYKRLSTKQEKEVYALQSEVQQMTKLNNMDKQDRVKALFALQREKETIRNQAKNLEKELQKAKYNLEVSTNAIKGMEIKARQDEERTNSLNVTHMQEIEQLNQRLQETEERRRGEMEKTNANAAIILQHEGTIDELRRRKDELQRYIDNKIKTMDNAAEDERNRHQYEIRDANMSRVKLEEEVQLLQITIAQADSERKSLEESEKRQHGLVIQLKNDLEGQALQLKQTVTVKDDMIRKLNEFVDEEKKKTAQVRIDLERSMGNEAEVQRRLQEIQAAGGAQTEVLEKAESEIRDLKMDIVHLLRGNAVGVSQLFSLQEKYENEIRMNDERVGDNSERVPLVASAESLAEQARLKTQIEELSRSLEIQKEAVKEAQAVALRATQAADELRKTLEQEEEMALHMPEDNVPIVTKQLTKYFDAMNSQIPDSLLSETPRFGDIITHLQLRLPPIGEPSYPKAMLLLKACRRIKADQEMKAAAVGNQRQGQEQLVNSLKDQLRAKVMEDNRRKELFNSVGVNDPGTGASIVQMVKNLKEENTKSREVYEKAMETERKLRSDLVASQDEKRAIVVQRDRMQNELIDVKERLDNGEQGYRELNETAAFQWEELKEREKKIKELSELNASLMSANDMNNEQKVLEQQEVERKIKFEMQLLEQQKVEIQQNVDQIKAERERLVLLEKELFIRQTKINAQQEYLEVSSQKVQNLETETHKIQFELHALRSQNNGNVMESRAKSILEGMTQDEANLLFEEVMSHVSNAFPMENSIRGTIYSNDAVSELSHGNKFAQFRNPSIISDSHSIIPSKVMGFYDISDAESSFYLSQEGTRKPNERKPAQVIDVVDSEMEGNDDVAPPAAALSNRGIPVVGAGIPDHKSGIPPAAGGEVFNEVHSSAARAFVSKMSIAMGNILSMQLQQAQDQFNAHAAASNLESNPKLSAEQLAHFDAEFAKDFPAKQKEQYNRKFGPKSIGSRAQAKKVDRIIKPNGITKNELLLRKKLKNENVQAKKALKRVFGTTDAKKAEMLPLRAAYFTTMDPDEPFPEPRGQLGFARAPTAALPSKQFVEDARSARSRGGQSIAVNYGTDLDEA